MATAEERYEIYGANGQFIGSYSLRVIKAFLIAGKLSPEDIVITSDKKIPLLGLEELSDFWKERRVAAMRKTPDTSPIKTRSQKLKAVGQMDSVPTKPTLNPFKLSKNFIKGGKVVFFRGRVLPPGPNPTYAGNLFKNSIAKMLYRMLVARKTGRFHFRLGRHIVDLFLEDGVPAYAVSNRNETRLGKILVDQGLLSPKDLEKALEQTRKKNLPLGQVLFRERFATALDIKIAFYEQLKERIYEVFRWREAGVYRFYENQITGCDFPFEAEPYLIIRDGVLEHTPLNIIEEQLAQYRFHRVARLLHPLITIEHFQPSRAMKEFYYSITNKDSLLDIIGNGVEQGIFTEEKILRMIYLFWQMDLIGMGEEMLGERTKRRIRELDALYKKLKHQTRMQRLGLRGGASSEEIREAYLKLAKKYHPDQLPAGTHPEVAKKAEEIFALISDAYHVLYDLAS